MIFTAGKRRGRWGGDSTLGESPSSAQLRPHGPWRTGEIRGPVLLQTLALYSYMTFENAKVAKIEKYIYIFKLKWQQKNFWYRNRWERNPKLQVLRSKHFSNVCKVHFVDNVLLSVQKGQVVHSFLCHGRAQDWFDFFFTWLKIHYHVTAEFYISH